MHNLIFGCEYYSVQLKNKSYTNNLDLQSDICCLIYRSNCDISAANTLRTHYNRPYFLPPVAESSKTDWIFMGSPGYGAHLHVSRDSALW